MKPFSQAEINSLKQDSERKWRTNLKDITTHVCYVLIMQMLNCREFLTKNLIAKNSASIPQEGYRKIKEGLKYG
jgi:hypothetical protein